MKNEIIPIPDPTTDKEWQSIVNDIVEHLSHEDLPEKVVDAVEMMLSGFSIKETAERIKVNPVTIKRWIDKYPIIALILSEKRENLIKWRLTQLEKQFLLATNRSKEILTTSFNKNTPADPNPKIMGVIAQQARYIISLFIGQKMDIRVIHEIGEATLNAKKDAMDYLVSKLSQSQDKDEPIEAIYKDINTYPPALDKNGNPPFGKMSIIDKNKDGILCHYCGKRYKNLVSHINNIHNMSKEEYRITYMIDEDEL